LNLTERVSITNSPQDGTRVLCYSEAWGQGGIETFLMNQYRRLQGFGFSFLLFSTWDWNVELDKELGSLGIPRWTVFPDNKPNQVVRITQGPVAFKQLIEQTRPNAVYINTMNGMGFAYSKAAKDMDVPIRVVHSHNSAFGAGAAAAKTLAHNLGRNIWGGTATARLAVSDDAGRYLFGKRAYKVINNGVDTRRFKFDLSKRNQLRDAYGIPKDALLFGSVGRIAEAKNPLFQIRTFAIIKASIPNAQFLMAGDGELRLQTEKLVNELGLGDSVIMPGYLVDSSPLYSALDCLLMPSLHEGLPMVSIEAQSSGLPILCSDELAVESHITNLEERLPLSSGEGAWAKKAIQMACSEVDRSEYAAIIRAAHFDACDTAQALAHVLNGEYDRQ
jgi:glycosyltransferase involved in cell wall biosynthesis